MRKRLLRDLGARKIVDFPEAGHEENSQLIVIALHDVRDEVLLEELVVRNEMPEVFLTNLRALTVLSGFHGRGPRTAE